MFVMNPLSARGQVGDLFLVRFFMTVLYSGYYHPHFMDEEISFSYSTNICIL